MQAEDFLLPGIGHLFQGEKGDRHPAKLRFDGEPVPFSQGLAVRCHAWFGLRRYWSCEAFPFEMMQPVHGCRHYNCINGRKPMNYRKLMWLWPKGQRPYIL